MAAPCIALLDAPSVPMGTVRVSLGVGEPAGFQGVVVGVVGLRAKWLDWAAR